MFYIIIAALILFVAIALAASVVIHTLRLGISPMPTSPKVKRVFLEALPPPSAFEKGSLIFDLGSGWGTLLVLLAKRYPHCQIVGIEASPVPYLFTRFRLMWAGLANVSLIHRDFFEVSLIKASMVVAYLFPSAMDKVGEKLNRELPTGTTVITHTFALPGWSPDDTLRAPDIYKTPVYLYHKRKGHS